MVGRITLCVKTPEYINEHFYGKVNAKHYIIEEIEFEKFEDVNHPNQGIKVSFKDPNDNDCTLEVSKYAWSDHDNGLFEALICDDSYLYELDVQCDDLGDIMIDQTLGINLYDVNDKETLLDCLEVTEWNVIKD